MQKIMYIVDYLMNDGNSVSEILSNSVEYFKNTYKQVVVKQNATSLKHIIKVKHDGKVVEYDVEKSISSRIRMISIVVNILYLESVIKKEKPDFIVYFTQLPKKRFHLMNKINSIPYCFVLYDTYLKKPNSKINIKLERKMIQNSIGYFVPDFFYDDYKRFYDNDRIYSYELPLLVSEEKVKEAYQKMTNHYKLSYFGQLQTFRDINETIKIFEDLGLTLDVFSTDKIESNKSIVLHKTLVNNELYNAVACSNFLVVIDNDKPYEKYLPSKLYLYVSFNKPIIVIGNDRNSISSNFLHNSIYYYHKYGDSLEGLKEFIRKNSDIKIKANINNSYLKYLPNNSLEKMHKHIIKNMI